MKCELADTILDTMPNDEYIKLLVKRGLAPVTPEQAETFYRASGIIKAEPKTPKIIGGITDTELTERTIKTLKLKK